MNSDPSTCNCGGSYAWRQDRLVCVTCGVPYVTPVPAPRMGETATDATVRDAQTRWDDYERERAAVIDQRVQIHAQLKTLATQTDDARLRLHQADSRLRALDGRTGALDKVLSDAKKAAATDQAKSERERVAAAEVRRKQAMMAKPKPAEAPVVKDEVHAGQTPAAAVEPTLAVPMPQNVPPTEPVKPARGKHDKR